MKQTIAAVHSLLLWPLFWAMLLLAGVTACGGARGSGHGRDTTAALAPNAGRGGVASPWLDDPKSYTATAGNEAAPAAEETESSDEESDDFDGGGGDDSGDEGGDDSGQDDSEPEIELEEGWGGDEDWDEEDPGAE